MKRAKAKGNKYAWTVKVGEKGQIVIPKEAREVFGIKPGDTLIMLADEHQGIAIPPKNTFSKLMGLIFHGDDSENEVDGDDENATADNAENDGKDEKEER